MERYVLEYFNVFREYFKKCNSGVSLTVVHFNKEILKVDILFFNL